MKFSLFSVLAFAAAVIAKPTFLNSHYEVHEGEEFTLKWNNAQGPVTITLLTGEARNLKKVTDLATDVTGNTYSFTPQDLPSGTYAFKITDATNDVNYSPQWEYKGTGVLPSLTSAESTASRSSSTVSSTTSTSSSSSTSLESSSLTSTTSGAASSTSKFAPGMTLRSTGLVADDTLQPLPLPSPAAPPSTSTTTKAAQTTAPVNSNNGQRFASPLALVAVTVAALVFFN
ncbi:hypothetical protein N0V88_004658 [Collariella sp. IMI 366227]|nr:hypothetical protein N0V88_004658 [Collariella sp. IMI 366227]